MGRTSGSAVTRAADSASLRPRGANKKTPTILRSVPTSAWDEQWLEVCNNATFQRPYVRVGRTTRCFLTRPRISASLRPRGTNIELEQLVRVLDSVPTSAWDEPFGFLNGNFDCSVPTSAWDEHRENHGKWWAMQRPYVRVGRTIRRAVSYHISAASLRPRGTNPMNGQLRTVHVSVPTSAWDEH